MNVGTLTIEIAANVARLQADMEATKRAVGGAMKDVEQYVGFAKTAFVAFSGVAGVASFAGMISGAISAKAKLADLSLQTGMSVESLASLARVGKFSDTALTDIAGASNKLSKALVGQNEDSKGAAEAIKALGLNFDAFKQLGPDAQMRELAKAMDGFEDGSSKSAAAMLLWGKSGAELLPFIKELSERNSEAAKETTANAKAAKEYEDNLVKLKEASQEWQRVLVNDMLPSLTLLTRQMAEAKTGSERFGVVLGNIRDNTGFGAFDRDRKSLENMNHEIGIVSARLSMYAKIQEALPDSLKGLASGGVASNRQELERLMKTAAEASEMLKRNASALRGEGPDSGPIDTRHFPAKPKLKLDNVEKATPRATVPRDDFTPLLKQIDEKIALDAAEMSSISKLTDAQRLQAKVFQEIDGGYRTLTLDQKLTIDGRLQEMIAIEKSVLARDAERKALAAWHDEMQRAEQAQRKHLDQAEEEGRMLQQQLADYGLTREELAKVTNARLRDGAATLRQQALMQEMNPDAVQYVRLLEEQAKQLERNADAKDELVRRDQEAVNRARRERQDPAAGASRAIKEYQEELDNLGDATARVVGGSLRSLEDGFTDLFTKGKFDTRSFVDTLISEFVRLQVVKPMMKDLMGGLGGGSKGGSDWLGMAINFLGGLGGGGGFVGGAAASFGGSYAGAIMGSARGNAFGEFGLIDTFARGGIVDRPTLFKFAQGGAMRDGLMGEAGPEAILPLTRGPGGRLGVASGGGGGNAVTVVQHVTIGAGVSPSQLAQAMSQAKEQAKAEIANQTRRGSRAYT